jgi:hypothetical protein
VDLQYKLPGIVETKKGETTSIFNILPILSQIDRGSPPSTLKNLKFIFKLTFICYIPINIVEFEKINSWARKYSRLIQEIPVLR